MRKVVDSALSVASVVALVGCMAGTTVTAGCVNDLGAPPPSDDAPAGRTQTFTDPSAGVRDIDATPDDDAGNGNGNGNGNGDGNNDAPADGDEGTTPAVEDNDAQPPASDDPDGDGAVLLADEPAAPPADAQQSCSEWTDCGPHFANENSGFDCVDATCTCDATGQWAQACADIGGSWSAWDCFCFVGTSPMPTAQAMPPNSAATEDEDVFCWWRWKDLGCDADRWVDTSYYERQCDSQGCWQEYVEDGYYEDGECYGRWVRRCSNGYEYW